MSKARVKQLEEQLQVLSKNFSSVLEELNARTAELAAVKRAPAAPPVQAADGLEEAIQQRDAQLAALTARHEQESKEIAQLIAQLGVQWERKKQQHTQLRQASPVENAPSQKSPTDPASPSAAAANGTADTTVESALARGWCLCQCSCSCRRRQQHRGALPGPCSGRGDAVKD